MMLQSGMARYGWLHVVETLAQRDITKFKDVLGCNILEVLTHLSYMIDWDADQRRLIQQTYRQ
jgi:hypothetical protein